MAQGTAQQFESDVMEDLAAEGPAEMAEEEFEMGEGFEEEEFEEMGELEGFEEAEGFEEEGFEEAEEFEEELAAEYGEEYGEEAFDAMEDAVADALEAEDTDEFFRRLARGIRGAVSTARRVAGTVGRVAAGPVGRIASQVAGRIPGPWGQIIARGIPLLAQLRNLGADELEAMDEFADEAAAGELDVDAAIPVIAGLAARSLVRQAGARLSHQARRQLVRGVSSAARTLVRRQGPQAIRALPRIVRSVRQRAIQQRTPVRAVARTFARTAARVVRRPQTTRRLARPLPRTARRRVARQRVRTIAPRVGRPLRSFILRGPTRITFSRV